MADAVGATPKETDAPDTSAWTATEVVAQFFKDELNDDAQPTAEEMEAVMRFAVWLAERFDVSAGRPRHGTGRHA